MVMSADTDRPPPHSAVCADSCCHGKRIQGFKTGMTHGKKGFLSFHRWPVSSSESY